MLTLCQAVQAPVKPEKVLGPSTTLPILGILLDTRAGEARLPDEKLTALQQELQSFHTLASTHSTCTKWQLLSLIGKLAFACKVIPAGRIFLRRLLDTAHSVDSLEHDIQIDDEALQDIRWWQKFSNSWNGKGIFLETKWTPAHRLQLFTDASSKIGFGAYWNGAWFSHTWPEQLYSNSIEWKELYAIVMAGGKIGMENAYYSTATTRLLCTCGNPASHVAETSCASFVLSFLLQPAIVFMF